MDKVWAEEERSMSIEMPGVPAGDAWHVVTHALRTAGITHFGAFSASIGGVAVVSIGLLEADVEDAANAVMGVDGVTRVVCGA